MATHSIFLLAAVLMSCAAVIHVVGDKECDFGLSCVNTTLTGKSKLSASCLDLSTGAVVRTSLDLQKGVKNHEGELRCEGTNFTNTCARIRLVRRTVLTAYCRHDEGIYYRTKLDLNDCIGVSKKGHLTFCKQGLFSQTDAMSIRESFPLSSSSYPSHDDPA